MLHEQLDYGAMFALFVKQRKISLLRYLFSLPPSTFQFTARLFVRSLELECYDVAALLHKEFFRTIMEDDSSLPDELE